MQLDQEVVTAVFCKISDPEDYFIQNPQISFKMGRNEGSFGVVTEEQDAEKEKSDFQKIHQEFYEEIYIPQFEELDLEPPQK